MLRKSFARPIAGLIAALAVGFGASQAQAATYIGLTYTSKAPSAWGSYQFLTGVNLSGTATANGSLNIKPQRCIVNSVGGCNWTDHAQVRHYTLTKGVTYTAPSSLIFDLSGGCHKYRVWSNITNTAGQGAVSLSTVVSLCRI